MHIIFDRLFIIELQLWPKRLWKELSKYSILSKSALNSVSKASLTPT